MSTPTNTAADRSRSRNRHTQRHVLSYVLLDAHGAVSHRKLMLDQATIAKLDGASLQTINTRLMLHKRVKHKGRKHSLQLVTGAASRTSIWGDSGDTYHVYAYAKGDRHRADANRWFDDVLVLPLSGRTPHEEEGQQPWWKRGIRNASLIVADDELRAGVKRALSVAPSDPSSSTSTAAAMVLTEGVEVASTRPDVGGGDPPTHRTEGGGGDEDDAPPPSSSRATTSTVYAPVPASSSEHAVRGRWRQRLESCLRCALVASSIVTTTSTDVKRLAAAVETSAVLFSENYAKERLPASWDNQAWIFVYQYRCTLLQDVIRSNPAFIKMILRGPTVITKAHEAHEDDLAIALSRLHEFEIHPARWKQWRQQALQQRQADANLRVEIKSSDACDMCKKHTCMRNELQTRSADEATTVIITCVSCGHVKFEY